MGLLDLYAGDASLECACDGIAIKGRSVLKAYWRPRLHAFAPDAFGLKEIEPAEGGVARLFQPRAFAPDGKIRQTSCRSSDRRSSG